MRRRALLVAAVVVAVLALAAPVTAQDPTGTTTTVAVPSQDIIPAPGEGTPPSEAGDRGGALQLALLAGVVVVIGGAVAALVRQSKRARGLD